ncbi:hypothetical protein ACP3V5_09595 [Vibrio maritimus]
MFYTHRLISTAFSHGELITVYGLANMWGVYGALLVFFYLTLYHAKDAFSISLPIGDLNKTLLICGILVAPTFALATFGVTQTKLADYVECKSKREISTRFSSRTYAISVEVCESLDANQ